MARRPQQPEKQAANLSPQQIEQGIRTLQRRIDELDSANLSNPDREIRDQLDALQIKIDQSLSDIFGRNTFEYDRYCVHPFSYKIPMSYMRETSESEYRRGYAEARQDALAKLRTALDYLREKAEDLGISPGAAALKAFNGLDLHLDIERRVARLYRDGHYSHAIEDACKALRDLVRLRSGVSDKDGRTLMEAVFSPKNPILKFNDLQSQSEVDEQLGFMMLFSGAVTALRNPRAHEFIRDDPERALEFIAFISLLAKILDQAKSA